MRNFFDTEFYEDGHTIDLISIGIVASDGRELYAVSSEAKLDRVDEWCRTNVLPKLPPAGDPAWMTRAEIRARVTEFVVVPPEGEKVEFWAYYADYDWVAFCQLFGTMLGMPKHFPKLCRDLKQMSIDRGSPKHPAKPEDAHDALVDARWNMGLHAFLLQHPPMELEGEVARLRAELAEIRAQGPLMRAMDVKDALDSLLVRRGFR